MFIKKFSKNLRLNLNQISNRGMLETQKTGERIPKIIHQTYPTREVCPEIQRNISKLKDLNPGWEYRFYDDNDIETYILNYFPEKMGHYKRINPKYGAARADFFRYLLIYKEGGVYLDIKSSLSKTLEEIIECDDQIILSQWFDGYGRHSSIENLHGEFQQWNIIAVAGHPFLKAAIENVCKNIDVYNPLFHETGCMGVLKVTGPIAYSLSILPLLHLYKHRVGFDRDLGLVYSIFMSDEAKSHQSLFEAHYSYLTEPVTTQPLIVKLLFPALHRLKNRIKKLVFPEII